MTNGTEITSRRYEPEIDGLRALAVLVVILFHAGFGICRGGFVGVDVFFVISGYLITRNILSDIARGTFSYRDFYFRRARRIFPAMFVTMLASTVAGFFIFSPLDLKRFAASLISACAAVSNIFFWTEAGYWDASKVVKPLLHFWSLGVEEQFYLFWPWLLLWLCLVFRGPRERNKVFLALLGLSLLSLFTAQYWIGSVASAVFYLTPFRVFEFGVGALTLWVGPFFENMKNGTKEACILFGSAAIIYSVCRFTEEIPFPGFNALLPCLGTALVISARTARHSAAIFRSPVAVGIGLISYSLYLVHWPIFVFFRYYHLGRLPKTETLGLIALCFVLSYLMYSFVEQPFRKTKAGRALVLTSEQFFTGMAILLVSLTAMSAYVWRYPGWSQGVNPDLAAVSESLRFASEQRFRFIKGCIRAHSGPCGRMDAAKHYVVLGDSLGEDLGIGLYYAYPRYEISLDTQAGCKALRDYPKEGMPPSMRKKCIQYLDRLFVDKTDWSRYSGVLLSMAWSEEDLRFLPGTVVYLRAQGAKRIIIVGPKLTLEASMPQILARSKTLGDYKAISEREMSFHEEEKLGLAMKAVAKQSGAEFLDVSKAQCPKEDCPNLVPGTLMPIIWDSEHWTLEGSRYVGANMKVYYPL